MKSQSEPTTIVDADGLILGRMATTVAKRLINGEKITVLNAEKAVISGKRLSRVKETKAKLEIGHPKKGPYFYKQPERFVKRVIRGMLPRKKPKGKDAYKRLKVYIGIPQEYKDQHRETISRAKAEKLKCPYITVGDLTQEFGRVPEGE